MSVESMDFRDPMWKSRLRQYVARKEARQRCMQMVIRHLDDAQQGDSWKTAASYLVCAAAGAAISMAIVSASGLEYTQSDMDAASRQVEQDTINRIYDQCADHGRWEVGTSHVICLAME